MVLIKTDTAANSTNRLRRRRGNGNNKAPLAMSMFVLFVASFLIVLIYTASRGNNNGVSRRDQQAYFLHGGNHGDNTANDHGKYDDSSSLHLQDERRAESADFFDTTASEIIEILNCKNLLADMEAHWKGNALVYGADSNPTDEEDEEDYAREAPDFEGTERRRGRRRRLREKHNDFRDMMDDDHRPEENEEEGENDPMFMGDDDYRFSDTNTKYVTAAHLFCLAAQPLQQSQPNNNTPNSNVAFWKDHIKCPVVDRQEQILDLWNEVRAEIFQTNIIEDVLKLAVEQAVTLANTDLVVYAPFGDVGTEFMVNTLNDQIYKQKNGEYGGMATLDENLKGHDKLFVDVGSGLGYTSMLVGLLYPNTQIVSVEAASTNYLLQQINWQCNYQHFPYLFNTRRGGSKSKSSSSPLTVILAGVGPSTATPQRAQFVWRPTSTTSTRAWMEDLTDHDEGNTNEAETLDIMVQLLPWHKIQTKAEIVGRKIDVLNVDCEGCEYNLIPALNDDNTDISTIMGELHWGYIPKVKLPSSRRAEQTHRVLCGHENFARASIECCQFPDVLVHSSISGQVLVVDDSGDDDEENKDHHHPGFPPKHVTAKDLAGELCTNFDTWAEEHQLYTVESDWGWLHVTNSMRLRRR